MWEMIEHEENRTECRNARKMYTNLYSACWWAFVCVQESKSENIGMFSTPGEHSNDKETPEIFQTNMQ